MNLIVTSWNGFPPPEHANAPMHLLSDRGADPHPARWSAADGIWWVRKGVPFFATDIAACGFTYVGPLPVAEEG